MYRDLTVAVVVPAFNEERLIASTVRGIPDLVDIIIVVDDASTDGTADAVTQVGDPRLTLIRHTSNTGVGGATIDGHRAALDKGADVCVVMDGDNQMDSQHLPALLDPIVDEGVEFTKANRFGSISHLSGMPIIRLLGSVILSFMTKAASGYWNLFDPQNGYTAVRRSALERLDLDALEKGYAFQNDLLVSLNIVRARARDVPIPGRYADEVSSMRIHREAPRFATFLFRAFWRRMILKYVYPSFSGIALLFFSGLALCFIGLGFGILTVLVSVRASSPSAGSVLLAVAPMLTGINMLIQSLALDIIEGSR